jgi:exopolysaccharide biosynthesis polyprenyl glycosylphosphotransferase
MIVSRTSRLPKKKLALGVVDSAFTALAMLAAVFLRLGPTEGLRYLEARQAGMVTAWAVFILSFYIGGLYESERLQSLGRTLAAAVISVALGTVLNTAVFFATAKLQFELGRGVFLGFAVFVLVAIIVNRLLYLMATRRGFMSQRCLIIGTNGEARKVIDLVRNHSHAGLKILGLIHTGGERERVGKFYDEYPILGTLDTLEKFVELYDIERLILAASADVEPILLRKLRSFRYRGLALVDFVSLYEELAQEIPLDHINDEWLFMASMNNSRIHIRRLKRLVDVVAAVLGLILSAPLAGLAALLIKLTSRGPVLYRQERLGRDSIPFTVLKFRTMREDAETQTGPMWATEDDPRITPVGHWLRKFRIDEMPQLWNVLRGDMSLVGPRPEREVFIKKLSERIPFYAERLLVPPGVTGWAQVMAPYAASVEESRRKLQFDLYYIKHVSFLLDVYVLLKTVKTIFFGRERAPKALAEAPKPRWDEIKTQTLYFQPPHSGAAAPKHSAGEEPEERRRTQRFS